MPKKTKSKSRLNLTDDEALGSKSATTKKSMSKRASKTTSLSKVSTAAYPVNSQSVTAAQAQEYHDPRAQFIAKYCSRRKEFAMYLKNCGIKAAVVRAIVCLYEEPVKPDNVLDYITCFLGANLPSEEQIKGQQSKIKEMRERISLLEEQNKQLQERADALDKRALENLLASEMVEEEDGFEAFDEELEFGDDTNNLGFGSCVNSNLSFTFDF